MNKEKMWKIIAIVACSLLVIIALTSFTAMPTSQYYDVCSEMEDIEKVISSMNNNLWMLSNELSNISSNLSGITSELRKIGLNM